MMGTLRADSLSAKAKLFSHVQNRPGEFFRFGERNTLSKPAHRADYGAAKLLDHVTQWGSRSIVPERCWLPMMSATAYRGVE